MLGLNTSFSLQGKDVLSTFLDMPFWIWDDCEDFLFMELCSDSNAINK
jgi:hypothetical protein